MPGLFEKSINEDWLGQTPDQALRTQRFLISFVGLTAILLPPILILIDIWFGPHCLRNSLSHYYYGRFTGGLFVITLTFIGALLMAYRAETLWISVLAGVAGFAAIIVAFFPTVAAGCVEGMFDGRAFVLVEVAGAEPVVSLPAAPFTAFPGVEVIHYAGAAVVFGLMFVFCAFVFPAVGPRDRDAVTGDLLPIKRARNRVYFACAALIALTILVLLASFLFPAPFSGFPRLVFFGETVALVALGVAWLVKGRVFNLRALGA